MICGAADTDDAMVDAGAGPGAGSASGAGAGVGAGALAATAAGLGRFRADLAPCFDIGGISCVPL